MRLGASVPPELAGAEVLDVRGAARPLGDAWAARDAIVIFVRHFACAGCAEHVGALRPRLAELATWNVGVTLVGHGTPPQLIEFVAREKLGDFAIEVVTDPTGAAYRAAGLAKSWGSVVAPRALANLVGLLARGYPNGSTRGHLAQQGGTLYVERGGEVALYHRSSRIGDRAPIEALVALALAGIEGAAP